MSSDVSHVAVTRVRGGQPSSAYDELAIEEPLEIRVRGRAISVTMRTPGHDDELAAGFLMSEGLITRREQIVAIEPCVRDGIGNIINVFLAADVDVNFAQLTRHVFASSSCGLCGKSTIDSLFQQFDAIDSDVTIDSATLLALPDQLRAAQETFARTGGLHAAAIFDAGELVVLREDIGRHNAVDKVLGYGLLNGLAFDRHVLLVSGRASFEIMQKALAGRVPILAALSAPSSLAVELAQQSGQTLIGFLREGRMNAYAHERRIVY